jgi:hypothetical protein
MLLSSPERVRARVGLAPQDVPDEALEAFIADEQAFVELATRRAYAEGGDGFELARAVVTELAALTALESLSGNGAEGVDYALGKLTVRRRAPLQHRLALIEELRRSAGEKLAALRRSGQARGILLVPPEEDGS